MATILTLAFNQVDTIWTSVFNQIGYYFNSFLIWMDANRLEPDDLLGYDAIHVDSQDDTNVMEKCTVSIYSHEDGHCVFLQNVGIYQWVCTVS